MEEKHEIITPNFVSKPSTTAPISATYKHIAAKVEFNGDSFNDLQGCQSETCQ